MHQHVARTGETAWSRKRRWAGSSFESSVAEGRGEGGTAAIAAEVFTYPDHIGRCVRDDTLVRSDDCSHGATLDGVHRHARVRQAVKASAALADSRAWYRRSKSKARKEVSTPSLRLTHGCPLFSCCDEILITCRDYRKMTRKNRNEVQICNHGRELDVRWAAQSRPLNSDWWRCCLFNTDQACARSAFGRARERFSEKNRWEAGQVHTVQKGICSRSVLARKHGSRFVPSV